MTNDTNASPAVPLFQRAHARMVTLQRVDEQIVALLQQRSRLQDELHEVQARINQEFERVTKIDAQAPATIISQISEITRGNGAAASGLSDLERELNQEQDPDAPRPAAAY